MCTNARMILKYPVVNMDEQPVQLVKETRQPLQESRGTCAGTITNMSGRARPVSFSLRKLCPAVRDPRSAAANGGGLVQEVAALLEGRYAHAEKVILICDNLNTHTIASNKAFPPERGHAWPTVGDPLHAQAWQLAQYRRVRAECSDAALPADPHRQHLGPGS